MDKSGEYDRPLASDVATMWLTDACNAAAAKARPLDSIEGEGLIDEIFDGVSKSRAVGVFGEGPSSLLAGL